MKVKCADSKLTYAGTLAKYRLTFVHFVVEKPCAMNPTSQILATPMIAECACYFCKKYWIIFYCFIF